ncbi:hypothetical protein SESBI_27261 [Sesbania bispinosa]|nr:hypothetical protein SESBI_27261 [Sesbania bispinosa]
MVHLGYKSLIQSETQVDRLPRDTRGRFARERECSVRVRVARGHSGEEKKGSAV